MVLEIKQVYQFHVSFSEKSICKSYLYIARGNKTWEQRQQQISQFELANPNIF